MFFFVDIFLKLYFKIKLNNKWRGVVINFYIFKELKKKLGMFVGQIKKNIYNHQRHYFTQLLASKRQQKSALKGLGRSPP